MTEPSKASRRGARRAARERKASHVAGTDAPERRAEADASELALARRVATLTPAVTLVAAAGIGATVSLGPALLVLAGGALFGTIAFFWASLRTLGGEAPLAEGFEGLSRRQIESPDGAAERKRTVLRALKDIEFEHSLGKLDDADFAELSSRYREEAKGILREMDRDVGPLRGKAEELARSYLAKRGIELEPEAKRAPDVPERRDEAAEHSEEANGTSTPARPASTPAQPASTPAPAELRPAHAPARRACWSCKASNERDAEFCKKCGERLTPRECPACSVVNEPDAAFCKKCGKAMAGPEAEKPDVVA